MFTAGNNFNQDFQSLKKYTSHLKRNLVKESKMNKTEEYLLECLEIAAGAVGLEFAKKSPEDLQHWVEDDVGGNDFIALVSLSSAEGDTPQLERFTCSFVSSAALTYDPTPQQRLDTESKAGTQAKDFLYIVEKMPAVTLGTWNMTETFRDQSFEGIGKGITFTIQVLDKNDYCSIEVPEFPEY
tara:strand:+ start:1012 stop:1563 length:552 start_codon:yes stop_codon:yes gene_type:complete